MISSHSQACMSSTAILAQAQKLEFESDLQNADLLMSGSMRRAFGADDWIVVELGYRVSGLQPFTGCGQLLYHEYFTADDLAKIATHGISLGAASLKTSQKRAMRRSGCRASEAHNHAQTPLATTTIPIRRPEFGSSNGEPSPLARGMDYDKIGDIH